MTRPLAVALATLLAVPAAAPAPAPGSAAVHRLFDRRHRARLTPLLLEVLRFPTVAGDERARADQQAWLRRTAAALGLSARDAGLVTEVELPGPPGAPVLGLIVHGDVQPVDAAVWRQPPFSPSVHDGAVWGRGAADDKGPLVQALLAMAALREAGVHRTHTVRLLVGSDEESGSSDTRTYLQTHAAPDYTLVLDATFPVVVGEKAWNALRVSADPGPPSGPFAVVDLAAGISPSIVPDRARLVLRWRAGTPEFEPWLARVRARRPPEGTTLAVTVNGPELVLETHGRAAHSGMNLAAGRNALVALARLVDGLLPPGGHADLLRFAAAAGADLHGAALDLPAADPVWGGYDVNVALAGVQGGHPALTINIRRPPPWSAADLRRHLAGFVERWCRREQRRLQVDPTFFYDDEPVVFDGTSPLVVRALAAYRRATGSPEARPTVVGGGTYAKRFPRAVAFGMWFPERPYPGHDVDEHVPVADLERGAHVLIEALVDLTTGERLVDAVRRKP
jgi:dipeptidase D